MALHIAPAAICTPSKREDLPAYARTGQLHSGNTFQEIASRCIDMLHAVHGADHDDHEELNGYLEDTGHPACTGELTSLQAVRVTAMFWKFSNNGDAETADRAELLLNAAGRIL